MPWLPPAAAALPRPRAVQRQRRLRPQHPRRRAFGPIPQLGSGFALAFRLDARLHPGVAAGTQSLVSDGQVHLNLQQSATSSSASACQATVSPQLPMTVQASTSSGGNVWVTAPAWFLGGAITTTIDPGEAYGSSPYSVPASLGITGISSNLGTPAYPGPAGESPASPTYGSVTITAGVVTALAILPPA